MSLLGQKIHKSYPILFFQIGILAGGIFSVFFKIYFFTSPLFLVASLAIFIISFLSRTRLACFIGLLSGMLCMLYRASLDFSDYFTIQKFISKSVTISGIISEDPDLDGSSQKIRLTHLKINNQSLRGQIFTKIDTKNLPRQPTAQNNQPSNNSHISLSREDAVILSGTLKDGFGPFAANLSRPKVLKIIKPDPPNPILILKQNFSNLIKKHIRPPNSSLALGYLIGEKSSLDKNLEEKLKIVGLTHIVVASGANLSAIINLIRKIFRKISRAFSFTLSALFVLAFVVLVGFSPSMSRAAVVVFLSLIAGYYGRKWQPFRLLLLAASITLLFSPLYLLDLGWLLSFSAFAGILICTPILTNFFYDEPPKNFISSTILETISATLLCLPILIYFFGSFSLISILANLLILPTISIAMALSFATGVSFFAPILATIFGQLATLIIGYHIFIINLLGNQRMFLITIPKNNPKILFLYFPILAILIYMHLRTKTAKHRHRQNPPNL